MAKSTKTIKITKFDKATCRVIGDAIDAALAEVGTRLGLEIRCGSGTFDQIEFVQKLKITIADPEIADAHERQNFIVYCSSYGLKPEHWGIEFPINGIMNRLIGINTARPKFAIKTREVDSGKTHIWSVALVPRIVALAAARIMKSANDAARAESAAPAATESDGVLKKWNERP